MSATDTGFVELPDKCSVAEALRKYSSHKAWSTRYANKVAKSQLLLDKAYDRRTDEIVSENIKKAEKQVAAMAMIEEFLVQKKYEKAKDHLNGVEDIEVGVAAAGERYTTNIHTRAAAANAPASPAVRRPHHASTAVAVKQISELKPDNQVQQAYLVNCLDSELYLHLTSAIAATTLVLGAGASC